ncbi:efflux RND transporter permease subunit [Lentimicrobium sp.]|jgi:multidrug efflux pump subunit AcrB|uniref:efflux RND transporter permease subunit n=1 Tax=Lentimicrobium sp. TaxID=2034841 RepID=UPI0025E209CA|nr:efflux RND transporter permease subunit [Lentimicrobium sp.]MCO5258028.1 efflux RND transporter permease subunit [Lentimicrobium sp.]HPR27055.1 efflux RND transporter permease subunit [Lentimicrobium sp.]
MSEKLSQPRNFGPTTWALKNKNTVFLLMSILMFFGIYSYTSLPKELFPDIVIPTVMVQTIYPGNPPVDIENLITRQLEKEIESVDGIKELSSTSSQDVSNIFVEFNTDVDIKTALQDVKDAVDKAKNDLPSDLLEDPMVTDIDFTEFPIININLSGDYSINELKSYAEYLEDEIETFQEVSKVEIKGVTEKEIKVQVDQHKLDAVELSFGDIESAIKNENVSMSGGEVRIGRDRRAVRISGEFTSVEEIAGIIVKHEDGNIVYLSDVADVSFGFEDPDSYARLNRQPVVSLQVVKKGGENLLNATKKVFDLLDDARASKAIPQDLVITITNDQSEEIRNQLSNLENSMIMGIIFVIGILFFFLGTRNSLFVALSIPLSMFISFMVMGLMDFRINMMVLFSLILALGMLVDNAVVVIENFHRFTDELGLKPFEAARRAVGEIAVPIITSTATTLAAFFPLIFWDSIMGEFMKYLPLTLVITLTASLFSALVIIPVVAMVFYKKEDINDRPEVRRTLVVAGAMTGVAIPLYIAGFNTPANLLVLFALIGIANLLFLNRLARWFQTVLLVWVENLYAKTLAFALKRRNALWVFTGSFVLMFLTMGFYFGSNPKVIFFPSGEPKYINILAELPLGTDIDYTDSLMTVIEDDVDRILAPEKQIIKSVLTNIGSGAVGENEGFSGRGGGPNRGLITVTFLDYKDRAGIHTDKLLKRLSDSLLGVYPGVVMTIEKQNEGPPVGKAINIEIAGRDFNRLLDITDEAINRMNASRIPGIEGLQIDLDLGQPEMNVTIDREKARRFGLSTGQIASTIRTAVFGSEVSKFKMGEDDYPIQLRMKDEYRYNVASVLNQRITFRDQASGKIVQVPVSAVADVSLSSTYGSVLRKDRDRVITIWSNVIEGYNATEINNQLKPILADMDFPEGYNYRFTGEQEEQAESMAFLIRALLIAVAVILLILVGQFNSVVKPFIILISVLLSTIGVFGGLATFGMNFVVIMTGVGIVSLAGVVVNNAIVLIDYIGLLKANKKTEMGIDLSDDLPVKESIACVIEAGRTRLRPVLLTAVTTILGLIPLAVGLNIDFAGLFSEFDPDIYFGGDNAMFWGPLSWTVIFGLTFATFLTLVVVPSMYHLFYMVRLKARAIIKK